MLAECLGLRTFLPDLRGHHVLVCLDSMTVVSYINRQGGLSSRCLFILAEHFLRSAQLKLRLLRATHVPGKLNLGADMLSRSNVPSRRVDAPPTNGSGNMGNLRQARGRPLCLRRQHSLSNLFFKGQGCVGSRLAQPPPLCFSPDRSDPAGNQANQQTEAQSSVRGSSGGTSIGLWRWRSCSLQPRGPFPWDETSSLRRLERFGNPSPNYERYLWPLDGSLLTFQRVC